MMQDVKLYTFGDHIQTRDLMDPKPIVICVQMEVKSANKILSRQNPSIKSANKKSFHQKTL